MLRFGVIDIGTNTCNLLIVNILQDSSFDVDYDIKLPVKLGRGGIHKDVLLPDAIERGLAALKSHSLTLQKFGVSKVKVVGTSAIRGAANKADFIDKVRDLLQLEIEILDGETEAALIFKGVQLTLPRGIGNYLIVDIGGGSIEFILANNGQVIQKRSYNIGIARAIETISVSDPISSSEINSLEQWFDSHLPDLYEICKGDHPLTLVGCSGAFDTFMDIYEGAEPDTKIRPVSDFPLNAFHDIHNRLIGTGHETRSKIPGMDYMRVEMIVVASVFTNFILRKLNITRLLYTHNSLKEGVMQRLIENEMKN